MYDIGVYWINATRYVFQAEPLEVTATFAHGDDPRFSECESAASVTLIAERMPDQRQEIRMRPAKKRPVVLAEPPGG